MTNKKDWDSFVRSKGRFKVHDFYQNNRIDCFNMWLDCEKNWDQVSLAVERLHQHETEAKQGMIAIQGKTIKATHSKEKADAIIEARKQNGMWYASEDFPDDDDDTWEKHTTFSFPWVDLKNKKYMIKVKGNWVSSSSTHSGSMVLYASPKEGDPKGPCARIYKTFSNSPN